MCSVLDVSRSGYYAWLKRPPSVREQADEQALNDIIEVYTASKGKLGQRKLWRRLVALDRNWGRHHVARLMRKNGLKAIALCKLCNDDTGIAIGAIQKELILHEEIYEFLFHQDAQRMHKVRRASLCTLCALSYSVK